MYTRSRSSGGGPGFGNGRGQMNPGNGNSFQGPHQYNHQGGNYQQSNYKPGIVQPSAPFKPSGPPIPLQQQAMKARQGNQPQQQQQQQQQQNQNQQQQPQKLKPILKQSSATPAASQAQPSSTPAPVPPPNAIKPAAVQSTAANASVNLTPAAQTVNVAAPAAVAPVAPAAAIAAAAAPAIPAAKPAVAAAAATAKPATVDTTPSKVVGATDESTGNKAIEPSATDTTEQSEEIMDGDDSGRWIEDEQGRWMDTDDQSSKWMETEDGQAPPKGRREEWRRVKKLTAKKPNKVLKRLRMNRRLRKTLMPKNAIMVLNEMKAGMNFTFPETQAIMPNSLFLVHAELEGKVYVGQGLSKPLARQNAAENALKCLLLEKMTAAAMKERVETYGENANMEVSESQPATESSTGEGNGEETVEENDDIPWSSLASFALYKLFLEWQNQGTVVPIPRPGGPPLPKNRTEPRTLTDKVLPTNALDIHPVMLLNQMRPGTTYNEVGRVGNPPNIQFTLGVEINGTTYTGTAKNKKDAKKIAAKEALTALFNLVYPDEPKPETAELPQ